MSIKGFLLSVALLFGSSVLLWAQKTDKENQALMPYPQEITEGTGKFRLNKDFSIYVNAEAHPRLFQAATRFMRRLDSRTGLFFTQHMVTPQSKGQANFSIQAAENAAVKLGMDESYELTVSKDAIQLKAPTDIGALRGLETLLQLVQSDGEGYYFPEMEITDSPRFPWRGLMIDVSRHFQPMDVIKRNIDGMAMVKLNVLHLHLVDDHGFRVESKVFPELTAKASDGEFFTQDEIREIIQYANDRGIRVMPEFDVPGHASSFLVAFPALGSAPGPYSLQRHAGIFDPTLDPTNEDTYTMLDKLFTEMAALFPDEYFHIGGDENEGHHWDANEEIQQFMKEKGLKSNHELQSYFNRKLLTVLQREGKKMMGWDEILQPSLPTSALIHSWRGQEGLAEAAKAGHKAILSNGYYIDLMYPAAQHYLNDPIPASSTLSDKEKKNILGGEATMWTELVTPLTIDSRIWPRTAVVAERLWSSAEVQDVEDMYVRLNGISLKLEREGLTHIRNRDVILRNLVNGRDISSLKVLADVCEPMKGYTRNPEGTLYATYSPYTLFADACIADAPDALVFNQMVEKYLTTKGESSEQIEAYLHQWHQNHERLLPVIKANPVLLEVKDLSLNLSRISMAALDALSGKVDKMSEREKVKWYNNAVAILKESRQQGGRTELQVVNSIEKIIKNKRQYLE
ncbi:hypothetical protein GCM10011506_45540 [Marivirga lumbricoides]|uniref:Beta-N-acetylhexosaminidase n=1 Tax=Marivirga lumbricoides TaxID=1046115 RepID=A0ABQ1N6F0_9BACT|nr:hypothetical protein GCM10011506_45540 [Marivirga lumbricoides]